MANLEHDRDPKGREGHRWKNISRAERENNRRLAGTRHHQITSSPEAYARYLDMQGLDNPALQLWANIALVMVGAAQGHRIRHPWTAAGP